MATMTKNYKLQKDAPEDFYDVGVVNSNLDKIDEKIKEVETEAKNKDGGNADTVDGKHASEFSLVGHTHNYLPLSGGTVSGDLVLNGELNVSNDNEIHFGGTVYGSDADFGSSVSANAFIGDGENITNVNAVTVGGFGIDELMKDVGTFTPSSGSPEDFNDLRPNTLCKFQFVAGTSQSGFHTPLGDTETKATWYNVLTFGEHDNRITQIATLPYSHQRETYIRYKHDSTWSDWKKINDGGNADTVDGKHASYFATAGHSHNNSYLSLSGGTVSGEIVAGNFTGDGSQLYGVNAETVNKKFFQYTTAVGSWFRLARNNKNSCGGVFVLTVGSSGCSSTTVFSATQQYSSANSSTTAFKILSHSYFNKCVTKFRVVNKSSSVDQYIDFYVGNGTAGKTDSVEVQFFGKGWVICDSIESCNAVDDTYTYTEFEI